MDLQAIVFDFDGVIADTEPVHLRAFQEQLDAEGLSLSLQEYMDQYLGYSDREGFAAVARDRGRTLPPDVIDALIARKTVSVQAMFSASALVFPGVADRIRAWSAHLPMAIASGALRAEIETLLDAERLGPCFRTIVSADDDVPSKPSPDPYRLALTRLAEAEGRPPLTPDRCVAIEDSLWGITSARGAGMRVVAVATSYAADALGEADLVVPGVADLTLDMLSELVATPRR